MEIIKKWLKANRRPVSFLVEITGLSRQALDGLLRGPVIPTVQTMSAIALATGIPYEQIAEDARRKAEAMKAAEDARRGKLSEPTGPGGGEAA